MHELAIAQSLIDIASAEAHRAHATRVTRLNCRIGVLRQVEGDLLRDAFEIAREGTPCAQAELCVEQLPWRAFCPNCRAEFPIADWHWNCPVCEAEGEPRSGGDELELVSIEAEVGP
jgi:hydrogenase nickel insertion protein HypA